jgi:hypothetical protein
MRDFLTVSYVRSLFFRKDHLQVPDNEGEKRESLVILEKVGMYEGLLKCLGTEGDVSFLNRSLS